MKLDMAGTGAQRKKPFALLREICAEGDWKCLLSAFIWGAGCFCYRQWIKGAIYLLLEAAFILFFVFFGGEALVGFFTLGVQEANPWFGIEGDNSITMLIWGIFAIIMIVVAVMVAWASVKSTYYAQCRVKKGEKPETFRQTLANLLDKNFYKTALFLPVISVCVFNILPIVFMILIAFTNYGGDIVPPKLVDWIGLANFVKLFNLSEFSSTLFKILEWNVMWAVMATA